MKNILLIWSTLLLSLSSFSQINNSETSKTLNSDISARTACTISITTIPATGPTICDGMIVFDFAGCSNFPFDVLFSSNICLLPQGVNNITTTTYSLTSICPCAYPFDALIFDNSGFFYQSSQIVPYSIATQITENQNQENEIYLYPNPSFSYIEISGSLGFNKLVLKSFSGFVIKEIENVQAKYIVDLKDIPSGLYLVELYDSQRLILTKKVIVQK